MTVIEGQSILEDKDLLSDYLWAVYYLLKSDAVHKVTQPVLSMILESFAHEEVPILAPSLRILSLVGESDG